LIIVKKTLNFPKVCYFQYLIVISQVCYFQGW